MESLSSSGSSSSGIRYSQLIPRSPPALPPILTRWPGLRKRAHPFTLPLNDDKQCHCSVSNIEPFFLLSSPRFVFSLPLVLLTPVNSCELHNYYLVLSVLLMYSIGGLSTDVFPNKTNTNS